MATTKAVNVVSSLINMFQSSDSLPPKPPDPPDPPDPPESSSQLKNSRPDKTSEFDLCLEPFVAPIGDDLGSIVSDTLERHDISNGGVNENLRVLHCSNISIKVDFEIIHEHMKQFGKVDRIKMRIINNPPSYDCYVTFCKAEFAHKALNKVNGKRFLDSVCSAKLFNINNVQEEESDYITSKFEVKDAKSQIKDDPKLVWHVANYKQGKENFLSASKFIQRKIGSIPKGNMKRYGKAILIKASNDIQITMLSNFQPTEDGNISSISPHKSFNVRRGIVYSRDLYEFEEAEILDMCPSFVRKVRKLKGTQHAIELTFTCSFLPEFIDIDHSRVWIKPFKLRPTQCYNCYAYGHVSNSCTKAKKCYVCSSEHTKDECTDDKFCFHCSGNHSPNWKGCPQFIFQQEVVNMAHNSHISIGEARRLVQGANKSSGASFASAVTGNNANQSGKFRPINKQSTQTRLTETQYVQSTSASQENEAIKSKMVQAEVHEPLPNLPPTPIPPTPTADSSSSNLKEKENSKGNLNKSLDGFQTPPKSKRCRVSSLSKFEIETLNKFEVLDDPSRPLAIQHPLEKLSQSQSCSNLNLMDLSQSQSDRLTSVTSGNSAMEASNESSFLGKELDESTKKIEKKIREKLSNPPSLHKGKSLPGSKLKRLTTFKTLGSNTFKAQPKSDLAGGRK